MFKKRIDKARIRNTNERLTKAGSIAIIYIKDENIREYIFYIKHIENDNNIILPIERLELEDLQNLTGLKALRITVPNY